MYGDDWVTDPRFLTGEEVLVTRSTLLVTSIFTFQSFPVQKSPHFGREHFLRVRALAAGGLAGVGLPQRGPAAGEDRSPTPSPAQTLKVQIPVLNTRPQIATVPTE